MSTFLKNVLALTARDITNKISDETLFRAWEVVAELDTAKAKKQFNRLDAELHARDLMPS